MDVNIIKMSILLKLIYIVKEISMKFVVKFATKFM